MTIEIASETGIEEQALQELTPEKKGEKIPFELRSEIENGRLACLLEAGKVLREAGKQPQLSASKDGNDVKLQWDLMIGGVAEIKRSRFDTEKIAAEDRWKEVSISQVKDPKGKVRRFVIEKNEGRNFLEPDMTKEEFQKAIEEAVADPLFRSDPDYLFLTDQRERIILPKASRTKLFKSFFSKKA